MPVPAGGRLVGRVDPAREGCTLVTRQVMLDGPKAVPAVAVGASRILRGLWPELEQAQPRRAAREA
jgi:hypothetical protein